MVAECEHGDSDVGEDEVLEQEIEELEELPGAQLGLQGEVVKGVVGLERWWRRSLKKKRKWERRWKRGRMK